MRLHSLYDLYNKISIRRIVELFRVGNWFTPDRISLDLLYALQKLLTLNCLLVPLGLPIPLIT